MDYIDKVDTILGDRSKLTRSTEKDNTAQIGAALSKVLRCLEHTRGEVIGRAWQFPHGHPLPPNRLRELGGDILAGPYLVSDYIDPITRTAFVPLTSPDLLKCRTRFFAIHFRIIQHKEPSQSHPSVDSASPNVNNPEKEQHSQNLSDLFSVIGLSMHRFTHSRIWYQSTSNDQSVTATNASSSCAESDPHGPRSVLTKAVPYERAQRLALLRSTRLHEALLHWLASPVSDRAQTIKPLHPRLALHNALELFIWIVNMYHHELHWPKQCMGQNVEFDFDTCSVRSL
ncbi:unnamed protein product [Echinostoma caproni]|uniref:RUN domain-containing protein n=1 Tax=Echinostoma caproni TaxID=27848 RepID=A0A183B0E8_9TREM|nr:unnamed protein product [Echinostoma caproni]